MASPLEEQEQQAIKRCADLRPWGRYFFHLPNSRWVKQEAWRLARSGVKRGLPDNWLMVKRGGYCGAVSELKRRGATPSAVSPEQREWLALLAQCGLRVGVHRGAQEAIQFFDDYWNLPDSPAGV